MNNRPVYNSEKHIKLLEYAELLEEQNKRLEDEEPQQYRALLSYSIQINDHVHWSHRGDYLTLIRDFLNLKINGEIFEKTFYKMYQTIEKQCNLLDKDYEKLKNIQPNPLSGDFTKAIENIWWCCEDFYPDFDEKDPPEDPYAKNETDFRNAVASFFPQLEAYL